MPNSDRSVASIRIYGNLLGIHVRLNFAVPIFLSLKSSMSGTGIVIPVPGLRSEISGNFKEKYSPKNCLCGWGLRISIVSDTVHFILKLILFKVEYEF